MHLKPIAIAACTLLMALPVAAKTLDELRADYDTLIEVRDMGLDERRALRRALNAPGMVLLGTPGNVTYMARDRVERLIPVILRMADEVDPEGEILSSLLSPEHKMALDAALAFDAHLGTDTAPALILEGLERRSQALRRSEEARLQEMTTALAEIEEARQVAWDRILEAAGVPPAPAAAEGDTPRAGGTDGDWAESGPIGVPTPPYRPALEPGDATPAPDDPAEKPVLGGGWGAAPAPEPAPQPPVGTRPPATPVTGGWGGGTPAPALEPALSPYPRALDTNAVCEDQTIPADQQAYFASSQYGGSGPHTVKGDMICLWREVIVMGASYTQRYHCTGLAPFTCSPAGAPEEIERSTDAENHVVLRNTRTGDRIKLVPLN